MTSAICSCNREVPGKAFDAMLEHIAAGDAS